MNDRFDLDDEEQQIEDEIDRYIEVDADTETTVRRIAQESRKRKNVNIRIAERDLSQIRERTYRIKQHEIARALNAQHGIDFMGKRDHDRHAYREHFGAAAHHLYRSKSEY